MSNADALEDGSEVAREYIGSSEVFNHLHKLGKGGRKGESLRECSSTLCKGCED